MTTVDASGFVGGNGSSSSWMKFKGRKERNNKVNRVKIFCSYSSSSVMDPYKTLKIQPDATDSDVRKAFRQLALKYIQMYAEGAVSPNQ